MKRLYLDVEVEVVSDLDTAWVCCLWPDGKLWVHWYEQLKTPEEAGS